MSDGIRVLHVDDDPAFTELVATYLEREREAFEVVTESDPPLALERIESSPDLYDCLVIDYGMTGMDGLELVSELQERGIDLPTILFTGKGSEEIASEAISMGVTDYLQKRRGTETYGVLASQIENVVSRRRSERARRQSEERYRRLVETSPTPISISDPDEGIVYANPRLAEFLGVEEPADLHGRRLVEYGHESDKAEIEETLETVVSTDQDESLERVQFRTEGGEMRYATLAVAPVIYDDIRTLQIVLNDVTEYERTRRDLAEKEVKYSTLAQEANDGVVVISDGRITFANEKAAEMVSTMRSELIGTYLSELVAREDADRVTEHFSDVGEDSIDEPIEFTAVADDGTVVPVEVNASVIEFDGRRAHMTIWRDITERKQRKRKLARYRTLVETAAEPMYLLDRDGTILMANDALVDLLDADREAVVGNHVATFVSEEDYGQATEQLGEIVDDDRDDFVKMEVEVTTALGERRIIETTLTVLTEDGEHDRTIGVSRDVTERKRREQNLAEYETIIETVPVGLFALDAEGTITWANDEFHDIVEKSDNALEGMDFLTLVQEGHFQTELVDRYLEIVRELLSSETDDEQQNYTVTASPPDGSSLLLDAHTALLPLEDGEFAGTVTAVRDITKQKEYEEELERQNERLERFASLVSHDLRNPLNVARGYVDIARTENSERAYDKIESSLDRMGQLIDELLTLAKQGQGIGELDTVNLSQTAAEAWENVSTGDATFETDGNVRVLADELRLQQLFENLIRNAIEHGTASDERNALEEPAEHGVPSVEADRDGTVEHEVASTAGGSEGQAQQATNKPQSVAPDSADEALTVTVGPLEDGFYVADDGVGIPEDEREDIFELGYTTTDSGTGFGLGIVTEVVEAHGWEVSIAESEDGGARFEITGVGRPQQ